MEYSRIASRTYIFIVLAKLIGHADWGSVTPEAWNFQQLKPKNMHELETFPHIYVVRLPLIQFKLPAANHTVKESHCLETRVSILPYWLSRSVYLTFFFQLPLWIWFSY